MFSLKRYTLITHHKVFYIQALLYLHEIQNAILTFIVFLLYSVNLNARFDVIINEELKKISLPTLPQVVYNLGKNEKYSCKAKEIKTQVFRFLIFFFLVMSTDCRFFILNLEAFSRISLKRMRNLKNGV